MVFVSRESDAKYMGLPGRSCDAQLMALTEARQLPQFEWMVAVSGTQVCRRVRSIDQQRAFPFPGRLLRVVMAKGHETAI
jgi:hypothetical protein